jgi:hypothetical protein
VRPALWLDVYQQASFTDASRVFVLSNRNQEANPAAGGHEPAVTVARQLPESGPSSSFAECNVE